MSQIHRQTRTSDTDTPRCNFARAPPGALPVFRWREDPRKCPQKNTSTPPGALPVLMGAPQGHQERPIPNNRQADAYPAGGTDPSPAPTQPSLSRLHACCRAAKWWFTPSGYITNLNGGKNVSGCVSTPGGLSPPFSLPLAQRLQRLYALRVASGGSLRIHRSGSHPPYRFDLAQGLAARVWYRNGYIQKYVL